MKSLINGNMKNMIQVTINLLHDQGTHTSTSVAVFWEDVLEALKENKPKEKTYET